MDYAVSIIKRSQSENQLSIFAHDSDHTHCDGRAKCKRHTLRL